MGPVLSRSARVLDTDNSGSLQIVVAQNPTLCLYPCVVAPARRVASTPDTSGLTTCADRATAEIEAALTAFFTAAYTKGPAAFSEDRLVLPLHHPAAWTVGAVAVALIIVVFALVHAPGIVHFVAHLPGIEGMIRQVGWDKAHAVYWHLRHLLP